MDSITKSQLLTIHAELESTLQKTRAHTARMSYLILLLVLVIAGYWTYLYVQFQKLNAESAADLAYVRALEYVRQSPPVLSKAINERAPEVFDYIEAQMLAAPAAISAQIQAAAVQQTQHVLDAATPPINKVITDAVEHAKTATLQAGFDGKDPAQLQKLIDSLAEKSREGLSIGFASLYNDYDVAAKELVAYLEKIAAGKNLDARQQHLRNVIIAFLAVAEKHKQMQ